MELKKQKYEQQLKNWIIASILLHLFMFIVIFFLYLEQSMHPTTFHNEHTSTTSKDLQAIQFKPLPKEQQPTYTLIPGRKAVTESEQTQLKPQQSQAQSKQEEQQVQESPQKVEQPPIKHNKTIPIKKTMPQRHQTMKQQLLESKLEPNSTTQDFKHDHLLEEKTDITKKIDTDEPTITKKKISLQDLKLGFAKFLNEGNNDVLIQHGNTNQSPDTQSLRHITYNRQIAKTIQEAFTAHSQYNTLPYIRGKKVLVSMSLERNGKLIESQIHQGSGNDLFDKVILESIQSVNLYPPVPKHITTIPHKMSWYLYC
ncbi:MAG: hypothetical protein CL947_00135 [Epsilonproteobacteria bacterium]|nr:hypothetical protein [Campylobacterota bacterium]|tara:strand:+ start:2453 stop:3391 length:939 start_codon:yes stop_codon:yes gene_type:complete